MGTVYENCIQMLIIWAFVKVNKYNGGIPWFDVRLVCMSGEKLKTFHVSLLTSVLNLTPIKFNVNAWLASNFRWTSLLLHGSSHYARQTNSSRETKSKQRRDIRSVIWSRKEHIRSDRSAFKTRLIVTSDMAQRSAHSESVPVISQKTRIF